MKQTLVAIALIASACASAPRLKPQDVVAQLVQFHGAVSEQFDSGGMELEHYTAVNAWIGDEIRVLTANPTHWEGQARLRWPVVRSICASFESLAPWTRKIDGWLQ